MPLPKKPSDAPKLLSRFLARLERSRQAFLAGLVVAFAIEIVVDWNQTFYDVNQLRAQLRAKAEHFVSILAIPAEDALVAHDVARLQTISRRLLADDEVAYVRFTDAQGQLLVDAGEPLEARYPKQVHRDVTNMLTDTVGFRARIAGSRHRDVFQKVSDAQDSLVRLVTGPPVVAPADPNKVEIAYQDRLYDESTATHVEDQAFTWALAKVQGGLVLIALKTEHLQAATFKKVMKGFAMTIFFLGVILVQQLGARKEKLKLLSLRDSLAIARDAIAGSLPPKLPEVSGLQGAFVLEQSERLGGTVYAFAAREGGLDVFLACPEGTGVDVAFASVLVCDVERRLRREDPDADPETRLRRFLEAYRHAPIHRTLDVFIARIDLARAEVFGATAGVALPAVLDARGERIAGTGQPIDLGTDAITTAVTGFRVPFPSGATLVVHSDGLPDDAAHPMSRDEVLARVRADRPVAAIVEDVRTTTLARTKNVLVDDLFVMALRRA